jgi:hypothetical protein
MLVPWAGGLIVLGGLLAGAYFLHDAVQQRRSAALAKPDDKKKGEPGEITLKTREFDSYGAVEPAKAEDPWYEPVTAYGRVVPNPLATVEVRSAFAGTLRQDGTPWPAPGQCVEAATILGWVDIRFSPQERLDLKGKLSEARLKHQGAVKALKIQTERMARLTGAGPSVPLREREEAEEKLTDAKTQEAVAKAAADLLQEALDEIDRPGQRKTKTWSQPLTAPGSGEVAELAARPGMAVEAGALVARLVNFRKALVRLEIPPEALSQGPPAAVELTAATTPPAHGARNVPSPSSPPRKVRATLVGPAPQVDPASQLAGYFYQADLAANGVNGSPPSTAANGTNPEALTWRPGLFVKADLPVVPLPGLEPKEAVSVPLAAVLYHQGRALVYVEVARNEKSVRFARREVQVLGRKDDRWVLAAGQALGRDDRVVVSGAQVLLSEEFRGVADDD